MANLVASLIAAEGITTTEAKAKAMRPIAEKMITKAKKGGVHNHRQVVRFLGDREMATKLFDEIGPRYVERPGGYTRIMKLGNRRGDNAPISVLELVKEAYAPEPAKKKTRTPAPKAKPVAAAPEVVEPETPAEDSVQTEEQPQGEGA